MWWLWTLACANPEIAAWEPVSVPAGEPWVLRGQDLSGPCRGDLVDASGASAALVGGTVGEDGTCALRIPRDLRPGDYQAAVFVGDTQRRGVLGVERPLEESACTGAFTANTRVSRARAEVVLERFYTDGWRDDLHVAIADVERVEYEERDDCGAVFLRRRDQTRVLYLDGPPPLDERAKTLARTVDRPLVRVER